MVDKPVFTGGEWDEQKLRDITEVIEQIADGYGLTYPTIQIEILSEDQMINILTSVGMPIMYHHWKFGKEYLKSKDSFGKGKSGPPYEIVINTDPAIAYCMETNTMTMMALVISHACIGHGSLYKNHELFKKWTRPKSWLSYLEYAKKYIMRCEELYGIDTVEKFLTACMHLEGQSHFKYTHPKPETKEQKKERQQARTKFLQDVYNPLVRDKEYGKAPSEDDRLYPQENLAYFFEKNSPILEDWQREILRIFYTIEQYFYPQMHCKIVHEGWASFWHYTIMTDMKDQGYIDEGSYLEFINSHTNAISNFRQKGHMAYINPYHLGFNIFQDLKRICENPTKEDKEWFPEIANTNWIESLQEIAYNNKDSDLIQGYMSPCLMRELKLVYFETRNIEQIQNNKNFDRDFEHAISAGFIEPIEAIAITDEIGYDEVRRRLADQLSLDFRQPNMEVMACNKLDNILFMEYTPVYGQDISTKQLNKFSSIITNYFWGNDVYINNTMYPEEE